MADFKIRGHMKVKTLKEYNNGWYGILKINK